LIPTPIQSALATLRELEVPTLLIGGQACILYGGAEFSRDLDLLLGAAPAALTRLEQALAALQADLIAVPPFQPELLERGHAIHFRSGRPDVAGLRLDLMTRPPRLPDLDADWQRRMLVDLDFGPVSVVAHSKIWYRRRKPNVTRIGRRSASWSRLTWLPTAPAQLGAALNSGSGRDARPTC